VQETINTRRQLQLIWGLIGRGHAKARDILAIDFGEWPLRGLDIALYQAHQEVFINTPFKKALTSKNLWRPSSWNQFRMGWQEMNRVWIKQRRIQGSAFQEQIKIYPTKGLLPDTLGHEVVHSLQRLVADPGSQSAPNSKATIWNDHVGQEMNAILSMSETQEQTQLRQARYNEWINKGDHNADPSGPDYFKREAEIQARLHSLLAHGYRTTWRRMPANRGELYEALEALGLDLPDSVASERASTDHFGKVKHFAYSWRTLSELKIGIASLDFTPAQTEAMWKKLLPRHYGFLLELYGDWLGRERMGLGDNPHRCDAIVSELNYLLISEKPIDWRRQFALFEKDPATLRHFLYDVTSYEPDKKQVEIITLLGSRFPDQTATALDQRIVKLQETLTEIQTGPQHNLSRYNENKARGFLRIYSDLRDSISRGRADAPVPGSKGQVVDRAYFGFHPIRSVSEEMLSLPPVSVALEWKADWFSRYGTLGAVQQVGRRVYNMLATVALGGALVLNSNIDAKRVVRTLFPQASDKSGLASPKKLESISAAKPTKGFKRPAIAKRYTQGIKPPKVRGPLKNFPQPSKSPTSNSKSHRGATLKQQR
jgi:hypothetical protein